MSPAAIPPVGGVTGHTVGDPLDEIIDALADAVFLVDHRGQIVHANAAGRKVLADQGVGSAAVIEVGRPRPDRRRGGSQEGESCDGVSVLTTRDGIRHVCHALQLRPASRGDGSPDGAPLRLVVIRTGDSVASASKILQSLFGLTGRESDVLRGLVEIGGVPDIAAALNISVGTTRSHLKALFAKTGTSRQSDLVRLLSDVASPFGPSTEGTPPAPAREA